MTRRLSRGILVSAASSVVLAGLLVIVALALARPTLRRAALDSVIHAADFETCTAHPEAWGWRSGNLSFFAYDRSGRSTNPLAVPLEPDLLEHVLTTGTPAELFERHRAVSVVPNGPEGPCALIRISSGNIAAATLPGALGMLGLSIIGGMLLAAMGTFWFVVRPLRRRIDALAISASGVGAEEFTPEEATPDALGHIAEVLASSHTRVVETREALEQRNQALEEHLTGIAHDLRTPLSSMQLALEAVAGEAKGPLQQEARRALADMVYLSSLVENLHQATRLRHAVDVSSGVVELGELVRRLERRFVIVGRHASVEVAASIPEAPIWAACTPALAERAIANLIQNAIEHNSGPGHVAITLTADASTNRFEVCVADDGPGLPEEMLASLDDETFLLESARRRGPSLGMLITAEVARRAGWSVRYAPLAPTGLSVHIEGPVTFE
ncbi:MAG: ATP-binding protein [Bradymonadia bacterium]